jgi:hypothetical protein
MRAFLTVLAAALVVSGTVCASETKDDGWKRIFDGKTLNGWKASERDDAWKVEDGAIVGTGTRSHLFYVAEEFKNFEFKVDVKTQPRTNSGIYFHTRYQEKGWPSYGYECQVNISHGDPVKTGSLYGVVKIFTPAAQDNKWWTQHIIVKGKSVTVLVDGKKLFEFVEPNGLPESMTRRLGAGGLFAFQQHDPGSEIRYRNVMVKRLK